MFNFHLKQLDYAHAAMVEVPKFRPDNKTPTPVQAMQESSEELLSLYLEKNAELKTARAQCHAALEAGHQAAVSVYAIMKSVYRNDAVATEAISKLPVEDHSASETLTRMGMSFRTGTTWSGVAASIIAEHGRNRVAVEDSAKRFPKAGASANLGLEDGFRLGPAFASRVQMCVQILP
jgi:hypothetical protein